MTPSEAIAAYHAMRPPRTLEEAITAARLLGLKGKAIHRIRRAYRPQTPPDPAMLRANANLGRAYCDASR